MRVLYTFMCLCGFESNYAIISEHFYLFVNLYNSCQIHTAQIYHKLQQMSFFYGRHNNWTAHSDNRINPEYTSAKAEITLGINWINGINELSGIIRSLWNINGYNKQQIARPTECSHIVILFFGMALLPWQYFIGSEANVWLHYLISQKGKNYAEQRAHQHIWFKTGNHPLIYQLGQFSCMPECHSFITFLLEVGITVTRA